MAFQSKLNLIFAWTIANFIFNKIGLFDFRAIKFYFSKFLHGTLLVGTLTLKEKIELLR